MNNKSFTLIELLVVIVIIGILAGVIMISTSSSIDKANFAKAQAFSKTVQNELLLNLVSEWTFDEGTTAVGSTAQNIDVRDTFSGNHGTVYGDPKIRSDSDCVLGKCLEFDGGNSYVDYGEDIDLKNIGKFMTISTWIKRKNDDTTNRYIISNDRDTPPPSGGYSLRISNNVLNGQITTASNSSKINVYGVAIEKESWIHVVFIFNGTTLSLFQNGKNVGNTTISNDSIEEAPFALRMGILSYNAPTYYKFIGLVDEFRIYNAALPLSQIKQNYITGLNSMLKGESISKEEYDQRINALAYEK
ncbi:MAG: LamG-like jellyroll fold domain-containing protein [Candidatus Paceibacterota bacterium]